MWAKTLTILDEYDTDESATVLAGAGCGGGAAAWERRATVATAATAPRATEVTSAVRDDAIVPIAQRATIQNEAKWRKERGIALSERARTRDSSPPNVPRQTPCPSPHNPRLAPLKAMPSDLDHPTLPHPRNVRRRPANAPAPLNWNRLLLLFVLLAGYSTFALAFHLPPWSTLDHFRHRNDKVLKHRPAFKNVERCVRALGGGMQQGEGRGES